MTERSTKHVVVIGAGATGLTAAYLLAASGASVTVLEAGPEPGGLLATFEAGGAQLERFYHHFFTHDAELHWLLSELGLAEAVTYRPTTMGLYRDGQIYSFDGPIDLLRFDAVSPWARLRFGMSSALLAYRPAYAQAEMQSALDWVRRWAGPEATAAIWAPMLRIKFGEAAPHVPLAWLAGRLRQRVRSRSGTTEQLGYLRGSLQVLVDRLVDALCDRGVTVRLQTPVEAFIPSAQPTDGRPGIAGVRAGGKALPADAVVATVPTPILADLVAPIDEIYARSLRTIQYMGALCTVLAFDTSVSPVYWLNVADPGYDFGGVIEQTRLVPPAVYGGQHIVYLSRYLKPEHPLWAMDEAAFITRQLDQLEALVGRPLRTGLRWSRRFKARYAAPQMELGFARQIPAYTAPVNGLYVASMPHVYPDERSTNNSIRIAADVVHALGRDASEVPRGATLAGRYG
jgi:protoporphyrinogen oxidase